MKTFYCPKCKVYLPDRYVEGKCPKCGAEKARGDQCDSCGSVLEPLDLIDPYCVHCFTKPEIRDTVHWFLDLPALSPKLKEWLEKNEHWPSNARNFPLGWIKEGLKPRAITRDLDWGVPVPLEEAKGKVIYVWFDAPIGYISATEELGRKLGEPELWKDYWKNPDCRIIHFLGKDNVPFHTIIWPAMLIGVDEGYNLPWYICSFEYLNFEGQKFSKSKGVGIWIDEAVELFPADYWRYALTAMAPQTRDSDFTWREFQRRINDELADIIGNFIHRTLTFIVRFFDATVPPRAELTDTDRALIDKLRKTPISAGEKLDHFDIKGGLFEILMLAKEGNRYFNESEPWRVIKKDRDRVSTVLNLCIEVVKSLAILLYPYMPESSGKIWSMCGFKTPLDERNWLDAGRLLVEDGQKIKKPEPLFQKIDSSDIEKRKAVSGVGKMELVSIDEFEKIKLKVATIISVERVKATNKLLKLEVSLGEERRQLVAGIADKYSPEELVGKKIIVVANLQPAKIRGIESHGMLLAAERDGKLALLTVDGDVPDGAEVS